MDFLPKIVYQDDNYLLARKSHGIASSWGQEECFLDSIKKHYTDSEIRSHQLSVFGEEGEYGLLNRLDNVTAGLLYFARSYEAKAGYMHLQAQHMIQKIYYAQVYGTPRAQFGFIDDVIYHDRLDDARMTIDPQRGRGQGQETHTDWEIVEGSPKGEFARLKVTIQSGTRHQIRVHLATMGHPIVGDELYMSKGLKKKYMQGKMKNEEPALSADRGKIELMSAGVEI